MNKQQILEIAKRLEETYNPYKKSAVKYFNDMVPMYLYANESMTEEEIKNAYIETAKRDIEKGYEERMLGYYDKWYRYSHADNGRAYDAGCQEATKNPKCSDEFKIIECC